MDKSFYISFSVAAFLSAVASLNALMVSGNLMINGDAEAGDLTGWTTLTGLDAFPGLTRGTTGLEPGEDIGIYSFTGGTGPAIASATQVLDLSSFSVDIDNGDQSFKFSALLQSRFGGGSDIASASVLFEDIGGNPLGVGTTLSDPADPVPHPWEGYSVIGTVPTGARAAVIEIVSSRSGGSSSDGFIDNVEFGLVPEPANAALWLGLSGVGFIAFQRRSSNSA